MKELIAEIGASHPSWVNADNPHGIHRDILAGGWARFIDLHVTPLIEWFKASGEQPRIHVYGPFSGKQNAATNKIVGPQFDQWQIANADVAPTVIGFEDTWSDVCEKADVWFYLGHLHGDNWSRLRALPDGRRFVYGRMKDSLDVLSYTGGNIVIDAFTNFPFTGGEMDGLAWAKLRFDKVMIEGYPADTAPYLWHENILLTDDLATNGFSRGGVPPLSRLPNVYRWVDSVGYHGGAKQTAEKVVEAVRRELKQGSHVIFPADNLMAAGIAVKDLRA
jgi:hypothetical protein